MSVKNGNNKVYETLKDEILYMDLLPGEVISEIEIAKRFSVSRTPVREAFKKLEYEGLLEIKSHLGTFVTLIDLEQISDIRFMREQIEIEVIRMMMNNLDSTIELKFKLILDKQKKLFEEDLEVSELAKRFIKSDNEFHETIFESANKSGVWHYLQTIEHHYERLRMFLNIYDEEYLYSLHEDHVFFFDCIVNDKFEDIKERYKNHLSQGIKRGADHIISHPQFFKDL